MKDHRREIVLIMDHENQALLIKDQGFTNNDPLASSLS